MAIVEKTCIVPDMADFGIGGQIFVPPYRKLKRKRSTIIEPLYLLESVLGGGPHRHHRVKRQLPTRASTPTSPLEDLPLPDPIGWIATPADRAGFDEVDNSHDDSGLISQ